MRTRAACWVLVFGLFWRGAPARAAGAEEEGAGEAQASLRADTTGFYPLWEGTGHVERAGHLRIGTTGVQAGVAGVLHFGVQPLNFVYRTPNVFAKVQVLRTRTFSMALQAGFFRLLAGASRATFSPLYSTRLDNPDFALSLLPVSASGTLRVGTWLDLHQTATGLITLGSGPLASSLTPGLSVAAELNPLGRHALTLHAAEAGFWAHDLAVLGASYRYRNTWLEVRLGYFYRFTHAGVQAAPLLGIGVLL